MSRYRGIVLYNIELDGNLNGVYTNNHPDANAQILTETARLVNVQGNYRTNGNMRFECFYFDHVSGRANANLIFNVENGIIRARWIEIETGNLSFEGEGFQMNDRQIALSYWFHS